MSGVNEIRSTFLDYFARNGHEVVPSSPLVPRNDPTLMFTNAGMVQFKNVFTGLEKRPYARAATAQKCVRAGGKHNDLDNVGYTARHHTFFEMLGNFSFGDYFKDRAIELAWNLITKEFGLPADRLMVTVYVDDDEAFGLWKKIAGLPDEQDHPHRRLATISGRWATPARAARARKSSTITASTSPAARPARPTPMATASSRSGTSSSCSSSSVPAAQRVDLPKPSIDTGMGLERIAAVLQGTHDNYKIDLFGAHHPARRRPHRRRADGAAQGARTASSPTICARRVPDRRRRAALERGPRLCAAPHHAPRHAPRRAARRAEPLMWRLVPTLVREMGQAYPELVRAEALIAETLKLEETRFRKTLERGLAILDEEAAGLKTGDQLQGRDRLHALRHLRLSARPDAGRAASRAASRSTPTPSTRRWSASARRRAQSWAGSGEAATEAVWFALREKVGATEFLGYETETAEGVVAALVKDGKEVAALNDGRERRGRPQPDAVLRRVRRPGRRHRHDDARDGVRFRVTDTQKKAGDLFVHLGTVEEGALKVGAALALEVDHAPPQRHPRRTIRRRICCTRRCARCSATTSRRRARWSRPTGCASTSRIPSR